MALSEELKRLYSSNENRARYYDTLELTHSNFTAPIRIVKDCDAQNFNLNTGDASTVEFQAFPFDVKQPEAGSNQQEVSIVLDNVSRLPIEQLELAAENIDEPIIATYRVYMDGSADPQTLPLRMVLTNIVATNYTVSAVATRPDLFKRKFPTGSQAFFDDRFQGLYL